MRSRSTRDYCVLVFPRTLKCSLEAALGLNTAYLIWIASMVGFNVNFPHISVIWAESLTWGTVLIAIIDAQRSPPNVVSTFWWQPDYKGSWKEDYYSPLAHLAFPLAAELIYLDAADADIDSFSNIYQEFQVSIDNKELAVLQEPPCLQHKIGTAKAPSLINWAVFSASQV